MIPLRYGCRTLASPAPCLRLPIPSRTCLTQRAFYCGSLFSELCSRISGRTMSISLIVQIAVSCRYDPCKKQTDASSLTMLVGDSISKRSDPGGQRLQASAHEQQQDGNGENCGENGSDQIKMRAQPAPISGIKLRKECRRRLISVVGCLAIQA
jgi:hypothetical protein